MSETDLWKLIGVIIGGGLLGALLVSILLSWLYTRRMRRLQADEEARREP